MAPSLRPPQVASLGRIHREGTWGSVVAVGAPRRWDWHCLDSGIARDLRVLVIGDNDARTCRWESERSAMPAAVVLGSDALARLARAVGTDPPPAPAFHQPARLSEVEVVAGPDFVAEPDPFTALGRSWSCSLWR